MTSLEFDDEKLDEHLIAIMAGPIAVGEAIIWPPLPSMARRVRHPGDEDSLAAFVSHLRYTEREWDLADRAARKLLEDQRRAHMALSGTLLKEGALPGYRVEEIVTAALV